jgi:photosystem II stability/assembly factor-like uncharacterized protein
MRILFALTFLVVLSSALFVLTKIDPAGSLSIGDAGSMTSSARARQIWSQEVDHRGWQPGTKEPAGFPFEAEQYNFRMRVAPTMQTLPQERYRAALEHMTKMPRYSTRLRKQVSPLTLEELSTSQLATGKTGSGSGVGKSAQLAVPLDTWEELGPGNVGGRTRAILIDPTNPNVMYAGGVSGGVWKTVDAGARWDPIADLLANINIGSMEMDPSNSSTIYVGTGEGVFPFGFPRGDGIFKTVDAGATWTQLTSTRDNADFHYVNKITISPKNPNRVYAATRTGVWRSPDGGASWTRILFPESRLTPGEVVAGGCLDLVLRTDLTTDILIASCGMFTEQGSLYQTLDGAAATPAWSEVLTEPGMGRTTLAIAPSNQATMYALAASIEPNEFRFQMLAFYKSSDGGATWTAQVRNTDPEPINTELLSALARVGNACTGGNSPSRGQGPYDNIIAVDPVDPNRVWAGGILIFRSTDGGLNWAQAFLPNPQQSIHVDFHELVFHPNYNGTTNQEMFVGNDGGLYKTDNAAEGTLPGPCALFTGIQLNGTLTWQELNNHYGVTQYYHGLPYPGGATYFGGAQDNGTTRGNDVDGPDNWAFVGGADGGFVAVDPTNTNILYFESQFFGFVRSDDGGATAAAKTNGITEPRRDFTFITPYAMDPNAPRRLWVGGRFPWRTDDHAELWQQAGTEIQDDTVNLPGDRNLFSAWAVAPGNSDRVLGGTEHGYILRNDAALTADAATAWSNSRPRAGWVSSLSFDPNDALVVYASYSTFNFTGHTGHIFKSLDGGTTWFNIDGSGATGIPDIPVHSIVADPADSTVLYAGTDVGVFVSRDAGSTWAVENTGFANVKTEALSFAKIGKIPHLFAFTHGRGAFRVATNDLPVNSAPVALDDSVAVGSSVAQEVPLTGYDPDVEALTFSVETLPANGTLGSVTPVSDNSATMTYTSNASYLGPDSFSFRVTDPAGEFRTATLSLNVVEPAPVPVVNSLSPASVTVGDPGFALTVFGSGFTSGSKVHWHNLAISEPTERLTSFVSDTQLTATIPDIDLINTLPIQVFVVTPAPGGGTSNTVDFTILNSGDNAVPTVTALSPSFAVAGDPGVTLSVQGQSFVDGSVVRWNGVDRPTTFVNTGALSADIPAADIAVKTVATVTVFSPSPGGGTSNAIEYQVFNPNEINPAPDYTAISPNNARVGDPGVTVTVTGSGFIPETIVRWNGADRPTTLLSDTLVSVAIPGSDLAAEGQALISVFNPGPGGGGATRSPVGDFFIFPTENRIPVLSSINPSNIAEGDPGFLLQIFGSDFSVDSVARWNGADRSTTFISPTNLVAAIPATDIATAGLFDVTVFNPAPGGGTSNVMQAEVLTVAPVPVLQALEPATVEAQLGATTITLLGTGFMDRSLVFVNGFQRQATFVSDTELQVTSNFFNGGSIPITVTNTPPGGGVSNELTLTVNYPVPVAETLSPASVEAGSGDVALTITGQKFTSDSIVRWDGADLATTNSGSSAELTAVVPAANLAAGGTAQVTVFNPTPGGGESAAVPFSVLDFSLTVSPGSGSTQPGGTANYSLTVSPQSSSFDQVVSFSCPNLAAVLSCAFSPATITPGAAAATTTLTVTTSAGAFVMPQPPLPPPPNPPIFWLLSAALGLGLVALVGTRNRVRVWLPSVALSMLLLFLTACGSGSAPIDPPRTFNITVAAASGSIERTTTVSLTVQ